MGHDSLRGLVFLALAGMLAAGGGTGCKRTPVADFTADPVSGTAPLTVQFTDQSRMVKDSGMVSWVWDFGDGATSTEQSPVHVYTVPGVYSVKLAVAHSNGRTHEKLAEGLITVEAGGGGTPLSNPGFETGETGWTVSGDNGVSVFLDGAAAFSGTGCAQLAPNPAQALPQTVAISQAFSPESSGPLCLLLQMRPMAAKSSGMETLFSVLVDGVAVRAFDPFTLPADEYTRRAFPLGTFTAGESHTLTLQAVFSASAAKDDTPAANGVLLDDAELVAAQQTTVPDLSGLTEAEAGAVILHDTLFWLGLVSYENSETVPAGQVIRQIPAPGATMEVGDDIYVTVSLGTVNRTVPNVAGMTEAAASAALLEVGLAVGTVTREHRLDIPAGTVVSQNPAAGAQLNIGGPVNLTVSLGPPDPVEISTVQDLQKIGNDPEYPLDGVFVVTTDIDASETQTWNDGQGFNPIGTPEAPFAGRLDGQGHTMTDLFINRPGESNVGVFRAVGPGATITGFGLWEDICEGFQNVGALAGINEGTIIQCRADVEVRGVSNVGGLCGVNFGQILWAHTRGTVTATGEGNAGGLVAVNGGGLFQAYAAGLVSSGWNAGGLVAVNSPGATVEASFWSREGTGQQESDGGTGLDDYPDADTLTGAGWDLENMWRLEDILVELRRFAGEMTPPSVVPDIVALQEAAARALVLSRQLLPVPDPAEFSDTVPQGAVIRQRPAPGTEAGSFSPVNYVLSLGPLPAGAIVIRTLEELQKIGNDPAFPASGAYVLANDISALPTAVWNEGKGFAPVRLELGVAGPGSFDGRGFEISALHINRPDENSVGLFKSISGSEEMAVSVRNLRLRDVSISALNWAGGVAGYVSNATIENCTVSGVLQAAGDYAGGIAGYAQLAEISSCSASVKVSAGQVYAGGIVGRCVQGALRDCQAAALPRLLGGLQSPDMPNEIVAEAGLETAGGLAGDLNTVVVEDCAAQGTVKAPGNAGGFVGSVTGGSITRCRSTAKLPATGTGGELKGGLAGSSRQCALSHCEARSCIVSGYLYLGGFAGTHSAASVTSCLAVNCRVSGDSLVGGFFGALGNVPAEGHEVRDCTARAPVVTAYCQVGGFIGTYRTAAPLLVNSAAVSPQVTVLDSECEDFGPQVGDPAQ